MENNQKKVNKLIVERNELIKRTHRFHNNIETLNENEFDIEELKARFDTFKDLDITFYKVSQKLVGYDVTYSEHDITNFEETFYKAKALATKIIKINESQIRSSTMCVNDGTRNDNNYSTAYNHVQLPKIKLPTFDGEFEKWHSFRDSYLSMVHNNTSLSDVDKFNYLKSSLSASALNIINSLPLSNSNYNIAWNLLTNRFDNKKLLIQQHLKSFFDMEMLKKENYSDLRSLIDNSSRHINSLKALDLPTDSWDVMLVHILVTKLDSSTRRFWELENTSEQPTLEEFKSYINKRCNALETLGKGKPTNPIDHKRLVINTNLNSKIKCGYCNQSHIIYKCQEFAKLSIEERIAIIKNNKLCFNCLRFGHSVSTCKSSKCRICNKSHHSLIHKNSSTTTTNMTTSSAKRRRLDSSDLRNVLQPINSNPEL